MSRQVVIALVLNGANELLVINRTKNTADKVILKWAMPGGGVEDGETLEQAAIREVLEETGHAAHNPKLIDSRRHPDDDVDLYYYRLELLHNDQDEITAKEEVGEVKWIDLAVARDLFTPELIEWLKGVRGVADILGID